MKTPPIFAFSLFFASLRCAACVEVGRAFWRESERLLNLFESVSTDPLSG